MVQMIWAFWQQLQQHQQLLANQQIPTQAALPELCSSLTLTTTLAFPAWGSPLYSTPVQYAEFPVRQLGCSIIGKILIPIILVNIGIRIILEFENMMRLISISLQKENTFYLRTLKFPLQNNTKC